MAQIRALVAEGVDLLIVSPNQSHTITPAIEEAFDAGVPVILFDRKIDSDKYTAFIGADNVRVGRILGDYLADILDGKGRVVEIQGLRESSPAAERHKGFAEALAAYPGLELVASDYGDWLQEGGARVMATTGWPGAPGKPSESRTGCRCWAWTPCRKAVFRTYWTGF